MRIRFPALAAGAFAMGLAGAGCQLGPASLRMSHADYNEAIQNSAASQLLLNLVRLKYREAPMVLDVGSISAQFEISQGLGLAGTLNENVGQALNGATRSVTAGAAGVGSTTTFNKNDLYGHNPDQLSINGQFTYAERPTVTYTPLQGQDFSERMLTPISLSTLISLVNSGWRIDRVISLTVQEMNGQDNVGAASGPTPEMAPEFETFQRATDLMRDLQSQRAISLEYETTPTEASLPVPLDAVSPGIMLQAAAANARFRPTPEGQNAVLTRDVERPILRINSQLGNADQIAELKTCLRLAPDRDRYPLVLARTSAADSANGSEGFTRLVLDTRSLMGVMFFLSQGVEAPSAHFRAGLVTRTLDKSGHPFDWSRAVGHLMRIEESPFPPMASSLSVRKGGYWYFIRDDDLNSKSTFLLLGQLFSLRAGNAAGVTPVLTLPLGG